MAYTVPSVQISQEFTQLPVFTTSPLAALIIGPHIAPAGYIEAIAVSVGGAGYTTPPTVSIIDPTGAGYGATAVANLTSGSVSSITVTSGGSNYSTSTIATISAPPNTATANAVVTALQGVTSIAVTNPGVGYNSVPTVTFTGGGFTTTAAATAVLSGGTTGYVTGVTITDPGIGYTSAPAISFSTSGSSTSAVATATIGAVSTINSISVTNGGVGYTSVPTVSFTGAGWVGTAATAVLSGGTTGYVTGVTITALGRGNGSVLPGVVFTTSGSSVGATAYPNLGPSYTVSAISVTNIGSGYTSTPTVSFTRATGDVTGTGATATVTLTNSYVTAVTVGVGGASYTAAPTVTITSPNNEVQATTGTGAITATTARAELPTPYSLYGTIGSVTTNAQVVSLFGDIAPQNTIAYGLIQALNNSNGAPVYYGVTTPVSGGITEEVAYDNVLQLAQKSNLYYGLVPLTFTASVQQDVVAHVNAMSSPQNALWRVAWLSNPISNTGTTSSQIAGYLASLFSSTLTEGTSANPNSGPRRVHNVFPPNYIDANNNTVNGYFLAAALAGLRSGVVPHQSLTNTQVIGPLSLPLVTQTYTVSQLNQLASAGVWIVTQAQAGGTAYTRHQLTGDASNLNYQQDSVTADTDSISYALQNALAPFIGIYNISPSALLSIQTAIDNTMNYLMTRTWTAKAGNQVLGYTLVSLVQDPTFQNQIDVTLQVAVPYPVDYITIVLSV